MNQDAFTKDYFTWIAGKVAPQGYDPKQLIDMIWRGIIGAITMLRLAPQSGTTDIYEQTEIIEK